MLRYTKFSLTTFLIPICLSVSPLTANAAVSVVINELMASNSNGERDPQGQREDWIEIYNYSSVAVNLSGMYLTDDLSVPAKWQIPAGITIPAGGYCNF